MKRSIKTTVAQLGNVERALSKQQIKAVKFAHYTAGLEIKSRLREATRAAEPASANGGIGAVDTGAFLNGWRFKTFSGSKFFIKVWNIAPHAAFVEHGRKAGKAPPMQKIYPWVIRKFGVYSKGLAFVIARAIGRRGLRGRKILEKNHFALVHILKVHVARALNTTLENLPKFFGSK